MNERLPFLQQKTSKLTVSPGVYLMKNKDNEIIYIGKAKNLRNRVTSYFRNNPDHTPKVAKMVSKVYDYDFIVTSSEYEALILECSLIKQHKPKYNILLKDDKGYHYIKISNEMYPKITAEKRPDKDGTFLGPYTSGFVVKQTVNEVNHVFKLPTCKNKFNSKAYNKRPCLNYHINQCIGVCTGKINVKDYRERINQAVDYIKSGSQNSISQMENEMQIAAENLNFERAAELRDRINAIKKAADSQIIFDESLHDTDIIAHAKSANGSCISLIMYRGGRLHDKLIFNFSNNECEDDIIGSFIARYYLNAESVPKDIIIENTFEDINLIREAIIAKCNHTVKFITPQRGSLLKYVMMAKNNANEYISIKNDRTGKEIAALEELADILGLKKPPEYIEAYDISNLASSTMVAGMIVFQNGRPLKSAYKRFSIKESEIQNDYACMREVLERRLNEYRKGENEGFSRLPDLIFVDGGMGQVNAVLPVLKKFGVNVPLYGLVKDSKHRTRAISTGGGEISVSKTKPAFTLITKIQDEVHRFSITYMRSKHTKKSYELELTRVKGIGVKKAQKIILYYKTKEALKSASVEELAKIAGVNIGIASELAEYIKNM